MCGISGFVALNGEMPYNPSKVLQVMNDVLAHRGPDGDGIWVSPRRNAGLAHRRLAIIDLTQAAGQPMIADNGCAVAFNGEIYNYRELQNAHSQSWQFRSASDTECILAAYGAKGEDCLADLRGMFAFALWDEKRNRLFAARDRFGIKPFYYAVVGGVFYFASEAKALLPFLPAIETDSEALSEYLTFQYTIGEKTLFKGVHQLLPGHCLTVENGRVSVRRYWDVHYNIDFDHQQSYFERQLRELLGDSLAMHLRSDVPIGAYISGGIDSSLIAILAAQADAQNRLGFHGRFTDYPGYDESRYADMAAKQSGIRLHTLDITAGDFRDRIHDLIWHMDFPVAGPGSFPQFMVSELASKHVKVVLGGQGGDEEFGGYARYLVAYFEQCIKAAIDGSYQSGNYVVTIELIIPNLGLLREYKPMIQEFWRQGLFEDLDARYFRLIDRSSDMADEVEWDQLDKARTFRVVPSHLQQQEQRRARSLLRQDDAL